jgi:Uma2 family endonuclease
MVELDREGCIDPERQRGIAMSVTVSPPARPFVAADLDTMPDDGYRREVVGGVLIVTPSPLGRHQRCVGELFYRLRAVRPAGLEVMVAPYDWRPPSGESFQPDLMVIQQQDFDPDGPLRSTPLLVVEVLSPSNQEQDRAVKRARYEALGVPAFWVVDPVEPSLTALGLDAGRYATLAAVTGTQRFRADFPYPIELAPADLVRP